MWVDGERKKEEKKQNGSPRKTDKRCSEIMQSKKKGCLIWGRTSAVAVDDEEIYDVSAFIFLFLEYSAATN